MVFSLSMADSQGIGFASKLAIPSRHHRLVPARTPPFGGCAVTPVAEGRTMRAPPLAGRITAPRS
jgi:hypothetical protein